MAESAITQDEQTLKQRAMRRLAIALTLIAVAIVALALLDRYNAAVKKTAPLAVPPREASEPSMEAPAANSPSPPTEQGQAQRPPPPPPPVVQNQEFPSSPPSARAVPPDSSGKNVPPASAIEKSTPMSDQAITKPGEPAVKLSAPPASSPQEGSASSTAGKGFIVQAGVFTSAANARTLQNKLAEKGILTHTETRVVVGPFKDRTQAEAVIRQLKELGVSAVVAPPPGAQ